MYNRYKEHVMSELGKDKQADRHCKLRENGKICLNIGMRFEPTIVKFGLHAEKNAAGRRNRAVRGAGGTFLFKLWSAKRFF